MTCFDFFSDSARKKPRRVANEGRKSLPPHGSTRFITGPMRAEHVCHGACFLAL
jgi:hypothetical protein